MQDNVGISVLSYRLSDSDLDLALIELFLRDLQHVSKYHHDLVERLQQRMNLLDEDFGLSHGVQHLLAIIPSAEPVRGPTIVDILVDLYHPIQEAQWYFRVNCESLSSSEFLSSQVSQKAQCYRSEAITPDSSTLR